SSLDPSADKFGGLIEFHLFKKRLLSLYWLFPSLGFFFLPLIPALVDIISLHLRSIKNLLLFVLTTIGLSYWIYKLDVFPLGNVFYLEGLYLKTDFRINFSLLDNVLIRVIFSVLIALSLILLFIYFFKDFKKYCSSVVSSNVIYKKIYYFMFSLLFLLSSFIFVSSDFYERYLLPVFIVLLLIIASYKPSLTSNKPHTSKIFTYILLFIFAFTSILLNQDYMENTRLRWQIARAISKDIGLVTDIYVAGPYGKYMKALVNEDFTGLAKSDPSGNYSCYVQEYTLDPEDSLVFDVTNSINNKMDELLPINKAPDTRKNNEIPRVKKNLAELSYDYGYKSYIYNLVGKSAGVGGWCEPVSQN
ncbi:MAG: hypothetical protein KC414_14275, partial [Romboutsia sp.]|nr:hypothetical protein [Romboutsia sp.]